MANLATLDENLNAPTSRIGSAVEATEIATTYIQADDRRAQFRTHIQGMFDGNAPYPKSKRDRTNLNFRQANAIKSQFALPYYDLLVEVPLLYDCQTSFGRSEERSDWSQIISEEFHRMVTDWEDWDWNMQFSQDQMLTHGIGMLYGHDQFNWMPDAARIGEVLVQDQAPARLSELEVFVIRKPFTSSNLMRFVENETIATELGWNVQEVKRAVRDSYKGTTQPPDQSSSWEWFQSKYKNSDIYFGTADCKPIWAAHVLVKEFDGRVSHHIIRTDKQSAEFLYSKVGRFDSVSDIFCPFFYGIGNGTWHSIRGLGTEIYPYIQIFNKLKCREVDAAMIAASVLVQPKDGNAVKQAQMLTLDNMKIIPEGLNFIEHAIGQNIQATVDVRRDMEQGMIQNIGGLLKAPGSSNPRKGQKQAILEMQQAAQLGKGKINQYYTGLDRLGKWMFNRASNPKLLKGIHPGATEALAFQARCLKRGVPPQALQEMDSTKAYRSIGAGSAANALMATEALMELAPSLNEPGRQAVFRLYISRLAGTKTADMVLGDVNTGERKTDQDWQASVENKMLRQGADGRDFIADDQNHITHAKSHIEDETKHLKEVEAIASQRDLEIEDLQPLYVHLESAGPHAHEHLEKIKEDPIRKGDYSKLQKQWLEVARMADQVKNNLEQMVEERQRQAQEQQAQQPQVNPELLKNLPYDKAPESVKMQMETIAGAPRQPGEVSVPQQNIQLKEANTTLKAERQHQQSAIDDIQTSQQIESHRREMAETSGNGNK